MANYYELADAVTVMWHGRSYPHQRDIDAALEEHYRSDARIRTAELHRNGAFLATVAHSENDEACYAD